MNKLVATFTPVWTTDDDRTLANTWEGFSPKADRIVRIVGDLRFYLYLLLEWSPLVTELCEQPFEFRVEVDGHWLTAIYDFWCRTMHGDEYYFDVFFLNKLKAVQDDSPFARQLRAREAWARAHELSYAIFTDKTLTRYPQELANWSYMVGFLAGTRGTSQNDLRTRVRRCIEAKRVASMREITACFADLESGQVQSAILAELHAGYITADLQQTLLTWKTTFRAL